jgi:hypothetical protein
MIKALSGDLKYANPATLVFLPFPSLIELPVNRFHWINKNGVLHFEFMGRTIFGELTTRTKKENFANALEKLYVYGTSGLGKSHLIAAFVCQLIRMGHRVLYLPDCYFMLMDPPSAIRKALIFAFHDTNDLDDVDMFDHHSMLNFISGKENLWIIVDQLNALEVLGKDDGLNDRKMDVREMLDRMQPSHRYVFSASANEASNREVTFKHKRTDVLTVFGGLSKAS